MQNSSVWASWESYTDSTNGVIWGQGYPFCRPMKDEWCVREYLFKKQSLFSQFYMVTKSPSNNKDFRDITTVQHNTGFMSVQQLMKSQSLFKSTIVCMYNVEILHIPTRFSYNWEKQTQHDISSPWCKESWYQHANKLWQYTTLNDIIGHYIRHCVCEIGHFKNIVYSLNVTLKCC